MTQNPQQNNNKNNNLSEQAVRDFIDFQKEELRIRQQENELKQMELQHSYELAKESLKQQGEYIKSAPRHDIRNRIVVAAFFILVLLIVSGVLIYCVYLGKEDIALRILEIVATAIISAGGGYAWGKSRGQNRDDQQPKVEIVE